MMEREPPIFMSVEDVMRETGFGKSKSYAIIKELNEERRKRGFKVIPGKVSRRYLEDRYGCRRA